MRLNERILIEFLNVILKLSPEMSRDPEVRMAYFLREKQLMDEAVGTRDAEIRGERRGEASGKASTIPGMLKIGLSITNVYNLARVHFNERLGVKFFRSTRLFNRFIILQLQLYIIALVDYL